MSLIRVKQAQLDGVLALALRRMTSPERAGDR